MTTKIIMTDGTRNETIYRVKSINPYTDETPGVWSPDAGDMAKQARSTRLVPSMFAGISARMQAMSDMPFTIYSTKGDKPLDDSDNYQNIIGFIPNPHRLLALSEGAMVLTGKSYWFKGTGVKTGNTKELKYWLPSSVTLDAAQAKKGEIYFTRQGSNVPFPAKQVLYMWLPDPDVELGPPVVYPFASALIAAEANGAITTWVRDYMKRGAVKAMLLMVDGTPPPGEQDRIESWFNKFMTGARGLIWRVFNSAGVKPTIIGDGLEALKDLSINKELRYEIHQALGTRHLLEDENLATANARERQFYTTTVVPDARVIQSALNEQILHEMNFHIEFEPERLEIFQENEGEQAKSFGDLFGILKEIMTPEAAFQLASEKLDYQFTDEQLVLIKSGIADKKKKDEEMAAQFEKQKEQNGAALSEQEKAPAPKGQKPVVPKALIELDRWEDKVNKAGKMVMWHPKDLDPDMVKAVKAGEITFTQAREQLNRADTVPVSAVDVLEGIRLALTKA